MYRIKKHIKMVNSHSLNNSCINNNPNIGSDPYWPRYDSNLKSYLLASFVQTRNYLECNINP